MWPWSKDSLGTLRGRVADVEGDIKRLRGEWADMYDRLARLAGRLNKRAQREMERLAESDEADRHPPERPDVDYVDDEVAKRRQQRVFPGSRG